MKISQRNVTNNTATSIFLHSLAAAAGLFTFGFGVYLTIQANIGVGPWDALNLGLAGTLGVKYGTASISVSLIILIMDILLKEKIGIGMFLDAFIVGKAVDFFNFTGLVPEQKSPITGIPLLIVGLIIEGFAQFVYMRASLGCGPRDSLLVAMKKRTAKIPIGFVSVGIMGIATLIGWKLGGPIGIGTLLCAFLTGPIMQVDFMILSFDPTILEHQDIFSSFKIILSALNRHSKNHIRQKAIAKAGSKNEK